MSKKPKAQIVVVVSDMHKQMLQMVETAKGSWALWFELHSHREGGGAYAMMQDIHAPLFDAIYHAQIHYVFIILSELYGKRSDVHSLKTLFNVAFKEGRIPEKKYNALHKRLSGWKALSEKVGELRGEHFGHKALGTSAQQLFKKLRIKIQDIEDMLQDANWMLWNIAFEMGERDMHDREVEQSVKSSVKEVFAGLQAKFDSLGSKHNG